MAEIPHYDVVIVGSGPAGTAAALRLQQLQLRVALVDQVAEDQFKIGESLPGAAIRLLRTLGIQGLDTLLHPEEYQVCTANASAWGREQWTYKDALLNPEGGGWHLLRHRFDQTLRQLAQERGVAYYNAKVGAIHTSTITNVKYTINFKRSTSTLPQSLSCNWLIDATGRASAILRQFGVKRTSYSDQMAVIAWVNTPLEDKDQTTRIKSVAEGWWYSAQLPTHKRVIAFHGQAERIARMVKQPDFFFSTMNNTDLLPYIVSKNDLITDSDLSTTYANVTRPTQVVGEAWLAVGDAALSFDPLSSQGIFFALYSGIRGAEAIAKCLQNPIQRSIYLQQYTQKVDSVFRANERSRKHYYSGINYH